MNCKKIENDIIRLKSEFQSDTLKTDNGATTSADYGFLNFLETCFFKSIFKHNDDYYSFLDLTEKNDNNAYLSYFIGNIILEQISDIYRWNLYYKALSGIISKDEYDKKTLSISNSIIGDILINKGRDDLSDEESKEIEICELFYNNKFKINEKYKKFIIPLNTINKELKSRLIDSIKNSTVFNYKKAYEITSDDEKIIFNILSGGDNELINIDELISYYCLQYENLLNRNRISKVECREMFGYYNCRYDFKDNNVSIIFGPNAFGKTTMLNIISYCFDIESKTKIIDNLKQIKNYAFTGFTIYFNDNSFIEIFHKNQDIDLTFSYSGIKKIKIYNAINSIQKGIYPIERYIANIKILFPNLKGDAKRFLKIDINRSSDTNLIMDNLVYKKSAIKTKEDVSKLIAQLIYSQRNDEQNVKYKRLRNYLAHSTEIDLGDVLKLIEESKKINKQETLELFYKSKFNFFEEKFAKLLNDACNCCLKEFLEKNTINDICYLSERRIKLIQEAEKYNFCNENMKKIKFKLKQEQLEILDLYSLIAFESLFKKYKLFKKYYESFYDNYNPSRKDVYIDTNGKLMLNTSNNQRLHFYNLSSGEVNVALILATIIFDLGMDSVLLVDEPEISLHIAWQEKLLENILKIIDFKGNTQVIMACHSPFICGGHDELIVEPEKIE